MPDSARSKRNAVLQAGEFFGRCDQRRDLGPVILARRSASAQPDEVPEHKHTEAHFILVLEGDYCSSARGASDPSAKRMLVYNPPGVEHRDRFAGGGGRFVSISIAADRLRELGEEEALPGDALQLHAFAMHAIAQRMGSEVGDWDASSPLVCESLVLALIGELQQRRYSAHAPGWISQAKEMLEDPRAFELSIRQIARSIGVHPVYLARAFRRSVGLSPGDYARKQRLQRAAGQLLSSERGLAEIALDAGFAEQSHFSKAFRRAYSTTPRVFREQAHARDVHF